MPIYDYECTNPECGNVQSEQRPYAGREVDVACAECGAAASYVLVRSSIQRGTEIKRGDKRIIVDERQVHNDHGKDWRDAGTTRRPGGIGRKTYFTR